MGIHNRNCENDWELTFINPVYEKGRFSEYQIDDGYIESDDDYQFVYMTLETKYLRGDSVTIIVGNHLPEETPFTAEYLLLVEKGNAKSYTNRSASQILLF